MIERVKRMVGWPGLRAAGVRITVYCRAGCSCCDKAMAVLESARRRHGFTIEVVDVDSDPELASRHGLEVPVVAVDGKVRFRGVVNPVLLERLLASGLEGDAERGE